MVILIFRVNAGFVTTQGKNFKLDGENYCYLGTNYWYGMNLGAPINGDYIRLITELDQLESIGVRNLRIMGNTQGPDNKAKRITPSLEFEKGKYNNDLWEGLDIFLYEMGKRDMKAVIPLNNYWEWSGGFGQLMEWYLGNRKYQISDFYGLKNVTNHYLSFIPLIINRKNTAYARYEGRTVYYKDDPTIMAWQLANEPRAGD